MQQLPEPLMLKGVGEIVTLHPGRYLGLAGGVSDNGRLNRRMGEEMPVEEVFVFPAMGDQGQPYGGVLEFLLRRDGMECWLGKRQRMDTLYYGRDFGPAIDARFEGDNVFRRLSFTPVKTAAQLLAEGRIVAIFATGMEFGPRA